MSLSAATAALAQSLPQGVSFAVEDPRSEVAGLFEQETAHIARAVPKRQREFAAGRRAARAALAALGHGACPILSHSSRAPVWPRGFIGSITHCDDLCFALSAHAHSFQSIGCDVEELDPMSDAVAEAVTLPAERLWLAGQNVLQPVHLFSAKEAVYKALFPVTGQMIGFSDVQICAVSSGRLRATLLIPVGAFDQGATFTVQSLTLESHVIHICLVL